MNVSMKNMLSKRLAVFFGVCLLVAAVCGRASALDVLDVQNMLVNEVPEAVIINMASSQGGLTLSEIDANALRSSGASENLISALGVAKPEPVVITSGNTPTTTTTVVASSPATPADGSPIFPASVVMSGSYPPLYAKEGWLSVSNRDWQPYFLLVDVQKKRMFLSRNPNGGVQIDSGQNVVLNIRKEGYKLYGDSGEKLTVKIRENLTTTLALEPFGVFGNSGLTGVATDKDKVRSEVLFYPFVPQPQTVIIERPAPVIVEPAPVYVVPGPRYYYGPRYHYRRW